MEDEPGQVPLFALKLELQHPNMMFVPTLDQSDEKSFQCIVAQVVDDIFQIAALVSRVAFNHQQEHYVVDMENTNELIMLREEIIDRVQAAVQESTDYVSKFEQYAHLWLDDRAEFLRQFLTYRACSNMYKEFLTNGDQSGWLSSSENHVTPRTFQEFRTPEFVGREGDKYPHS